MPDEQKIPLNALEEFCLIAVKYLAEPRAATVAARLMDADILKSIQDIGKVLFALSNEGYISGTRSMVLTSQGYRYSQVYRITDEGRDVLDEMKKIRRIIREGKKK